MEGKALGVRPSSFFNGKEGKCQQSIRWAILFFFGK